MLRRLRLAGFAFALTVSVPAAAQPSTSSSVLPVTGLDTGDAFGRRVAVSGATLVVGANGDDERGQDSGAAYVFDRAPDGSWTQTARLLGSLQRAGDYAGWSVAIDGDTVVVGAPGDDRDAAGTPAAASANRGAAYVFRRTPAGWTEEARLQPVEMRAGYEFGARVAINGDTALVSVFYLDLPAPYGGVVQRAGAVWVYRRTAAGWVFEAVLTKGLSATQDGRFGFSVDIEGDVAVVGEPGRPSVTEFRRTGATWAAVGTIEPALSSSIDGTGAASRFASVVGLAAAADGATLALEQDHAAALVRVRRVTPQGLVATLLTTTASLPGGADQLAASAAGELFFPATTSALVATAVRRIDAGGRDTVLSSSFTRVTAVEADEAGGAFVADGTTLKHLAPTGTVTLLAGVQGDAVVLDGAGPSARFRDIRAVARTATGDLLLVDGSTVRRLVIATRAVVTLAGVDEPVSTQVDGPGTTARFVLPASLAVTDSGNVYITDLGTIRRMSPAFEVSTIAGVPNDQFSQPVDGVGASARLVAGSLAPARTGGGLVFSDRGTIRTLDPSGRVTAVAGLPQSLFSFLPNTLLYGYSLDLRGSRLVVGMPGGAPPFSPAASAGMAWMFDRAGASAWNHGLTVVVDGPQATERYGEAVAITPEGDLVVGAANGCNWVSPGQCANASIGTSLEGVVNPPALFRTGPDGTWVQRVQFDRSDTLPQSGSGNALAFGAGVVAVAEPASDPGSGTVLGPGRVLVFDLATLDVDGDTLPDQWESQFALDRDSAGGPNGRDGDPDGDGQTNAAEFSAQTHPRSLASATRYFAEGATSAFFETRLALANPGTQPARVGLRFTLVDQSVRSTAVLVPPGQSRKVTLSQVAGLAAAEFSTVVETDQPVVAERQMWWSATTAYGTHSERAMGAPALTWYLAEGATHSGFDLFYLLQNPNAAESAVRVRYLRPSGAPLEKTYTLPANSRTNIWVNVEQFAGQAALASTDVSAAFEVQNGQPIIVERAMYLTRAHQGPGSVFEAGHESAGVVTGSTEWFLAEGATGDFFDLFVLVANPGSTTAAIEATYLLPDGSNIVRTYSVPPASRFNIWVDLEDPRLADTAVSTTIRSTNGVPIIVERAMWWPGPTSATWTEAHNSPGSVESGTRWGIGDGIVQDVPAPTDTYILVANVAAETTRVRVTLLFDDGGAAESREFDVAPRSRFNVDVRAEFAGALGRGFGALVESLSSGPIVVERAIYNDALGIRWAAGNNALGTRLQ